MLHTADNVRYVRELTGMSQSEFGELFDYTKDKIQSYELNRAKAPADLIDKLAELIDVTPEYFKERNLEKEKVKPDRLILDRRIDSLRAAVQNRNVLNDYQEKYHTQQKELMDLMRHQIAILQDKSRMTEKTLELSLGELRHNILLARAMAEVNQNLLIELLSKQKKTDPSVVAADASKQFAELYKRMKEEGSFSYVGK